MGVVRVIGSGVPMGNALMHRLLMMAFFAIAALAPAPAFAQDCSRYQSASLPANSCSYQTSYNRQHAALSPGQQASLRSDENSVKNFFDRVESDLLSCFSVEMNAVNSCKQGNSADERARADALLNSLNQQYSQQNASLGSARASATSGARAASTGGSSGGGSGTSGSGSGTGSGSGSGGGTGATAASGAGTGTGTGAGTGTGSSAGDGTGLLGGPGSTQTSSQTGTSNSSTTSTATAGRSGNRSTGGGSTSGGGSSARALMGAESDDADATPPEEIFDWFMKNY